uniref:EGF-like domain-containing protein n=1 Tax=Rhabditophanes sp. KR3021 TaxID=114890 RepID=A0AC35TUH5_9BILA
MKVVTACKLSLLSLLALILYTNANIEEIKFPGNHEEFELLKKFHETWDNSKPLKYVDHEVFVDVPLKNNAATNLGGNYGEGCDVPGYTGQYCESPICANTNLDEDNHSQDPTDVMIDFGHYPVCNVPMPLYYDVSMLSFKVEIHAGGAHSPIMVLYNSTGAIIAPSKVEQFEMSRVIYYFTPQQPGVYQLSPNTDIPSSGCYIYVNSLAYSNIHMGFIPHTANDLIAPERNDSPNTRSYQGQLNTIVAHPINIRYPGNIATVALYEQFNLLTRPQKLAPRYGCEFNHFYNAFYCYRTGTYFAKFTGYDFFGNKYKRVKAFVCEVNPHPPTVAPPTPPVTSCQNNGTLIDNGDGTSSCFCVGPFSGPACGVATCYNGALALPDGTCQCTDNFMGPNCADVLCFPDSGITIQEEFYTPIFVIRVRSQLRTILQQISTQLNNLNTFFQNDPKWFSHFGVVIFNNNGTTLPSKFYDNVADLSDDLLAYSATADNTGGCFDMTFEALDIALNVFILGNKSPIYVISDALPSDPDYLELTSELDSFYLSPIYFIQLEPSVASGCQAFDYYTPGWRALETLAMRSSGNVFFIANNEYGTFGTFFYQHMANTYFMSELMYVDTQRVCANQPKYIFVGIDGDFHQLTVVATGVGLSLQLTTPEGNNAQFDTLYISQNNYMWRLRGLEKGNWQSKFINT